MEAICVKCGNIINIENNSKIDGNEKLICYKCANGESMADGMNKDVKIEIRMKMAGFKSLFVDAQFDKFEVKSDRASVIKKRCVDYVKNYDGKTGFFFHGSEKGTGKSYLSACIARELLLKGIRIQRIHILNLLSHIRSSYNNNDITEKEIIDKYITPVYLIVDDIGSERPTENTLQILNLIVNERYENEYPTSWTSNLDMEQIEKQIDDRIASRISGACRILDFKGLDDYRLKSRREGISK